MLKSREQAVSLKNKGNEFYKSGRYQEALDCYREAIAVDSTYQDAWFNLGLAHKMLMQTELALDAFRTTLELDVYHAKAHYQSDC